MSTTEDARGLLIADLQRKFHEAYDLYQVAAEQEIERQEALAHARTTMHAALLKADAFAGALTALGKPTRVQLRDDFIERGGKLSASERERRLRQACDLLREALDLDRGHWRLIPTLVASGIR